MIHGPAPRISLPSAPRHLVVVELPLVERVLTLALRRQLSIGTPSPAGTSFPQRSHALEYLLVIMHSRLAGQPYSPDGSPRVRLAALFSRSLRGITTQP